MTVFFLAVIAPHLSARPALRVRVDPRQDLDRLVPTAARSWQHGRMRKPRLRARLGSLLPTAAALVALSATALACSPGSPPGSNGAGQVSGTSAPVEDQSRNGHQPAAPVPTACGASAVPTMSTRDKLAQLLMVGV